MPSFVLRSSDGFCWNGTWVHAFALGCIHEAYGLFAPLPVA